MADKHQRSGTLRQDFKFPQSVESFTYIDDGSEHSDGPNIYRNDGPYTAQTARAYQGRASLVMTTAPGTAGSTPNRSDERFLNGSRRLHPIESVESPSRPANKFLSLRNARFPPLSLLAPWLSELLWILVSILSLIIIVTVLKAYNGQPLSRLPMHITLNTFIAFFTTLAKAAFMVPVAEAISQWKWNWFHTDKPLADFEAFDDASRGIWGSLFLMNRLRRISFASLGALVTIISILTSPLTQQLIAYPSRPVPSELLANTSAVRSWAYDWPKQQRRSINLDMQAAVLQGFEAPIDQPLEPAPITCATGDCSFPRFNSLGMCVQLANVTSHLNVTESDEPNNSRWNFNVRMPNVTRDYQTTLEGWCQISGPSTIQVASCKMPSNTSFGFGHDAKLMEKMVYSQVYVYSTPEDKNWFDNQTDLGPMKWQALEAFFHLCVQTYDTSVKEGKPISQPVSTSIEQPVGAQPVRVGVNCTTPGLRPTLITCNFEEEDWWKGPVGWMTLQDPDNSNSTSSDASFRTQNTTLAALVSQLYQVATFQYMYNPRLDEDLLRGDFVVMRVIDALYGRPYSPLYLAEPMAPAMQFARVESLVGNVANSITKMMRTSPVWTDTTQSLNSFPIAGTALALETFVEVRWGWLAFLVVEILLTISFLVATVVVTRRLNVNVLKSSSLATLLALSNDCRSTVGGNCDAVASVKAAAKKVPARFTGHEIVVADAGGPVKEVGGRARADSEVVSPRRTVTKEAWYFKGKD